MKFRLTKDEDSIVLELFLKAIKAGDDYQSIRFMIKDGKVKVNGSVEYARRLLLFVGDEITFEDKYYIITSYKDDDSDKCSNDKKNNTNDNEADRFIFHHNSPLKWSKKYSRDK